MTKYSSAQHFVRSTIAFLLIINASLQACAPSISLYSETAYQQAVELKLLSLQMMDHASTLSETSFGTALKMINL